MSSEHLYSVWNAFERFGEARTFVVIPSPKAHFRYVNYSGRIGRMPSYVELLRGAKLDDHLFFSRNYDGGSFELPTGIKKKCVDWQVAIR